VHHGLRALGDSARQRTFATCRGPPDGAIPTPVNDPARYLAVNAVDGNFNGRPTRCVRSSAPLKGRTPCARGRRPARDPRWVRIAAHTSIGDSMHSRTRRLAPRLAAMRLVAVDAPAAETRAFVNPRASLPMSVRAPPRGSAPAAVDTDKRTPLLHPTRRTLDAQQNH
jgi:hypothetical protein